MKDLLLPDQKKNTLFQNRTRIDRVMTFQYSNWCFCDHSSRTKL